MVYINSQKFACASCIKGHRSSSCHHTDRPLFEVKKKGRPVSQCERCRELRKNKRMHVKCNCASVSESTSSTINATEAHRVSEDRSTPCRSAPRRLPSNPTLPNGLKDLWLQKPFPSAIDSHAKQRVVNLLNPCKCKSVWNCQCLHRGENSPVEPLITTDQEDDATQPPVNGLKSCCGSDAEMTKAPSPDDSHTSAHRTKIPTPSMAAHREQRLLASMPYVHSSHTRTAALPTSTPSLGDTPFEQDNIADDLALPPLTFPGIDGCGDSATIQMLPSLRNICEQMVGKNGADAVASLTRCGCGSTCSCPGCKEHRGVEMAALSGEDCPDKCGSCVDNMQGLELPSSCSIVLPSAANEESPRTQTSSGTLDHARSHAGHRQIMSTLDHFYAIAAHIPLPPPSSRSTGIGTLDATNVIVYRQPAGRSIQSWQKATGLVQLPPLNCCAGSCKCTGGRCGCGSECSGDCGSHVVRPKSGNGKRWGAVSEMTQMESKENGGSTGGCCAGKKRLAGTAKIPLSSKGVSRL